MIRTAPALIAMALTALHPAAHAQSLITNGDFESAREVTGPASRDDGFGVWALGEGRLVPDAWQLNPAYPGELALPQEGSRFARITAGGERRVAHIYQPCPGIESGQCYLISARSRGGPVAFAMYEYHADGPIAVPTIASAPASPGEWRSVAGYYWPAGDTLNAASLAIIVPEGATVDIDDIEVEPTGAAPMPDDAKPITLENERFSMTLSPRGMLTEFICKATGVDYARTDPQAPVFRAQVAGGEMPVTYIERDGDRLVVHFPDPEVVLGFTVESRPHSIALTLASLTGQSVEGVQLCDLRLDISENVGTLINAAWDDTFAACVLACNEQTHSYGADGARAALSAKCYEEFGMIGARVAIIGTELSPARSSESLLDRIEEVELAEGLPHPEIDGVWIKRAPQRFSSYLMAAGVGEANVDEVIEFARGGFGCVEMLNWWESTPTYAPHPGLFPNGYDGLKECADKIHAAGLEVGMHAMQAMVGWGGIGLKDPYVSPVADRRLLQDHHAPLAEPASEASTELAVDGDLSAWPETGDLIIDGEVVRYAARTESSFTGCTRGLHGTTTKAHEAGTQVGRIVNCFNMWDHVIYAPDVNSTMIPEACDALAKAFNVVSADMAYFDGGEEVAVQPPQWHNQGKVALGVMGRLDKPVILEGNALYTHLAWHVISRGSPSYDPMYYGRRDYTLRAKGQNPANWGKNLLTGDVGWFAAHTHSPSTHAVTPDELMLLCLKALAGKAPISFIVSPSNLYANRRMPEMLEIIRACDELKLSDHFSPEVRRAIAEPWTEHVLDRAEDGDWQVRPMAFGPARIARSGADPLAWSNPHDEQPPWIRLRGQTRLAEQGSPDNIVLADFADGPKWDVDSTATGDLTQSVATSDEPAPDGAAAFRYTATNGGNQPSGFTRLALPFDSTLDLSSHRRIGVWVKAGGEGGILNIQLAQGHGYRDHYIDLDYDGWKHHVLDVGESSRYWDYRWPYNFTYLLYWQFRYSSIKGINVLYNDLPPGAETSCLIGRIEALREHSVPVVSPALSANGTQVTFPVSLRPDEYVELDWDGSCRHFEPNGGLLADVQPIGGLRLEPGENHVALSSELSGDASGRAELTLATRGEPLANEPRSAAPPRPAREGGFRLVPAQRGSFRVVDGAYERVGREPARSIPEYDGAANVWTVEVDGEEAQRVAIVVSRSGEARDVDHNHPGAIVLEDFGDLSGYAMSDTNQFEQYVIGGGKQLTDDGPVRAGVSQALETSTDGPQAGPTCGRYTARNDGGGGGWCAKGKRFAEPMDLSSAEALGLWVDGDGKGETLLVQLRDSAGKDANWFVPIDFAGWQQQVFAAADAADFDWTAVEYLIFYYNNLPAASSVSVGLDDLKAIPEFRTPPPLDRPAVTLNGRTSDVPVSLGPDDALTIDGEGRRALWRDRGEQPARAKGRGPAFTLRPGANRLELTCKRPDEAPSDVVVQVLRLGPVDGESP